MLRPLALLLVAFVLGSAIQLQAQGPDVMYLRFNEGSGSTTADFAVPGVGSAPTLLGACGFNLPQAILGGSCLQAGANSGSHLDTGATISLLGDWTIEFWCVDTFSTPSFPTPQKDVFSDGTTGGMRGIATNLLGNLFDFAFQPSSGTSIYLNSVLPQQTWTHFAFTHNSLTNTITVYLNGAFHSSNVYASPVPLQCNGGNNLIVGGNSFGTWVGLVDEFRIWSSLRTATDISTHYNAEISTFTDNLSVDAITSPSQPIGNCALAGAAETVSITMTNNGSNTIAAGTLIPIDLVVDGGTPITEFALVPAGGYANGASFAFSFATTVDLSALGSHSLVVTAMLPLDQNAADDSQTLMISSGGDGRVTTFPWTEDFDSLSSGSTAGPLGWTQETTDSTGTNSDWIFLSGSAGTASTSPSGDHTSGGGIYAIVEDSSANHAAVSMWTPCLDLSNLANPNLSFWFHSQDASFGLNSNPMSVDVSVEPAGMLTLNVFGPEADIGNGWMLRSVDLSPFAGQVVRLRFRGRSDGGTAKNDTAIDDVRVYDAVISAGQPPVAGTAVMDLNTAIDGNGATVGSLNNGPYFASAVGAGALTFSFEGEANRPFALLIGPLNPVAATYPNVGQLDIGGTVDPMTGIPSMIQVLADGFNPVDFIDLLFNTGATGTATMSFQAPVLPPGVVGSFQALFSTGNGFFFAISNAIELTII